MSPELAEEVRLQGHRPPVGVNHPPVPLLGAVHLALIGLEVEHDETTRCQEQAVDLAVGEQEVRGEVDGAWQAGILEYPGQLLQLLVLVAEAGCLAVEVPQRGHRRRGYGIGIEKGVSDSRSLPDSIIAVDDLTEA